MNAHYERVVATRRASLDAEAKRKDPMEPDELARELEKKFRNDRSPETIAAFLAREFVRARNQVRRELAEVMQLDAEDLRPPGALVLSSFQRAGPDGVARAVEHHVRTVLYKLLQAEVEPLEFTAGDRVFTTGGSNAV